MRGARRGLPWMYSRYPGRLAASSRSSLVIGSWRGSGYQVWHNLKDGVPRRGVARPTGEIVAQPAGRQRDQRDGGGSPRPAAAEIPEHDQRPLVVWPDAVAVDEREPRSPGVRDRLAGPRMGPGRRSEPAEEVGDACRLVFAAVRQQNRGPIGSGLVLAHLALASQNAGQTAVYDEMQSRWQVPFGQVAAVPALDEGTAGLGDDQAERVKVGQHAVVERLARRGQQRQHAA